MFRYSSTRKAMKKLAGKFSRIIFRIFYIALLKQPTNILVLPFYVNVISQPWGDFLFLLFNYNIQINLLIILKMKAEYSLGDMETLYSKVINAHDLGDNERFAERLGQLGKLLVWSERNQAQFFQYFCEVKVLDFLLDVFSKAKSKEVVISIIGFFNLLLTNLNDQVTINYLLSHPCIISLQNIKFVALDNEIAEYYINFLKGLSRKLNNNTLHLFFNKKYPTFPLIMQTTRFYNHPENLVRATCRNILLTCLKLDNQKVRQFAAGFPFVIYFIHECNFLKQYWFIIDSIIESEGDNQFELQNLDTVIQDHEQLLLFFEDFMKSDPTALTHRCLDSFANECLSYLLQTLYSHKKMNFGINVVLFVSSILLKTSTTPLFSDFIVFSLFGQYYTEALSTKLMCPIQKPISYSKQWKFKGFWDSHQKNISDYCVKTYFEQQKKIVSDIYASEEAVSDLKMERKYSSEVRSIFGMGTNFYDRQAEKLENIFGICIKSDPATFKRKSASDLFLSFRQNMENLNVSECEQNPVRNTIFSFLKSKDDTMVLLTLNLFTNVFKNQSVSEDILQFCSLSTSPKVFDFKSVIDVEQILKSCFNMMASDPPPFRICTYKEAESVIGHLSEIYKGNEGKMPKQLLEMAKNALRQSIDRINQYIYTGDGWEKSLDIFNKVSEENEKKRVKNLYYYGFLKKSQSQIEKLTNSEVYDVVPKNVEQTKARDFWLYIIIRDSYCRLARIRCKYEVTSSTEGQEQKQTNFELGSAYKIEENHEILAAYKQMNLESFAHCSLIFLGGFFVIGVKGKVKHKYQYQQCLVVLDRSDPKKLLLQTGPRIFVIQLENVKQAYEVRKTFMEMKNLMFKYQLSMLVKQTQWMLSQTNN